MPESQLPDRVLMFMERNDLPVYIDKQLHKTYRFHKPDKPPLTQTPLSRFA